MICPKGITYFDIYKICASPRCLTSSSVVLIPLKITQNNYKFIVPNTSIKPLLISSPRPTVTLLLNNECKGLPSSVRYNGTVTPSPVPPLCPFVTQDGPQSHLFSRPVSHNLRNNTKHVLLCYSVPYVQILTDQTY